MTGMKITGTTVSSFLLTAKFGLWGLLVGGLLALALMALAHLPELTGFLEVVYRHRDSRWLLEDDDRTNRRIALDTHVPVPEQPPVSQDLGPSRAGPPGGRAQVRRKVTRPDCRLCGAQAPCGHTGRRNRGP